MYRRLFYVVYMADGWLQRLLDAMRFVANPKARHRAHITIRGPYRRKHKLEDLSILNGAAVSSSGVGNFFEDGQTTVFLRCDSSALRQSHKLGDYGYNPHITLYNGESREFAQRLYDTLSHIDLRFDFHVRGPTPLYSMKDQFRFTPYLAYDEEILHDLVLSVQQLRSCTDDERILFVRALAELIADAASRERTTCSFWPTAPEQPPIERLLPLHLWGQCEDCSETDTHLVDAHTEPQIKISRPTRSRSPPQ